MSRLFCETWASAQLTGSNAIVGQFIYATGSTAPDYMFSAWRHLSDILRSTSVPSKLCSVVKVCACADSVVMTVDNITSANAGTAHGSCQTHPLNRVPSLLSHLHSLYSLCLE